MRAVVLGFMGSLAVAVPAVNAASLYDYLELGAINLATDQSAESIINVNGAANQLDVGDRLRGIFQIDKMEPRNGGMFLTSNYQLTAVFEIEVKGMAPAGTINGINQYNFIFGPSANFEQTYGAGAMVAMYEDTVQDFIREGAGVTIASAESRVTDGDLIMTFGFNGDQDERWLATGPNSSIPFDLVSPGQAPLGSYLFAVNLLSKAPKYAGLTLSPVDVAYLDVDNIEDDKVQFTGTGLLLGTKNRATPYDMYDTLAASFMPVPEPGTLGLLGTGLIAFGLFGIRRRRMVAAAA